MSLNHDDADHHGFGKSVSASRGKSLVGIVVKFPNEGRIVRFGHADGCDESATVIILPVIRIERYAEPAADSAGPQTPPPAATRGGRRRVRRR